MLREPSARELIEAVGLYLENVALPALTGHAAFTGRVAANALAIAKRELDLGPAAETAERARLGELLALEGDRDALNRALCAAIRAGRLGLATSGLMAHVRASVIDRVAIEQPTYASYRAAREGRSLPW